MVHYRYVWALALQPFFFIFARAQLVGGGGCTEVGEVGRGGERNVSWGFGEGFVSRRVAHFSVTKKDGKRGRGQR